MKKDYHYIIAGAGCAGLSLLMRMMNDPFFAEKKILVVDSESKHKNDRTWCFWETATDIFESIVFHKWNSLSFFSTNFSGDLQIDPYVYKMIRGVDFYSHVKQTAATHTNIEWLEANILSINNSSDGLLGAIKLANKTIYAEWVFNSILFNPIQPKPYQYNFLQHFKGWEITTDQPVFNAAKATFMDFRVSQQAGTTFIYVLPTSPNTALIEYTLFTEQLLDKDAYDLALKAYIKDFLGVDSFIINHEEFGIIPMTNMHFPQQQGRLVYMGIAGGQAKASSGYAFKFIQRRTQQIIDSLKTNSSLTPNQSFKKLKGELYDSTLLNVLHNNKLKGDQIFAAIFKKNKAADVLQFLDNKSSLLTDFKIMRSVPMGVFLPAALKELFVSAVKK